MDGYVNGVIGGKQKNGSWKSSDFEKTGMPVALNKIDN